MDNESDIEVIFECKSENEDDLEENIEDYYNNLIIFYYIKYFCNY